MRNGTAVLLSSHVAEKISTNCTRALWLDQGGLRAIGRPEEVLHQYQAEMSPALGLRADQAS
jgi:ABC-type polysaccharide/polyol phosphate transport system ATPase subunit